MKVGDKIKCIKSKILGDGHAFCTKGNMYIITQIGNRFDTGETYCIIGEIYEDSWINELSYFDNKDHYDKNKDIRYQHVFYIWDHFESKTMKARRIIKEYEKR